VTFRPNENWEVDLEVVFPSRIEQLAPGQVDDILNEALSDFEADGIRAEWGRYDLEDEGNVSYRIHSQGQGWVKLNTHFFDNQALIEADETSNPRRVYFFYDPVGSVVGFSQHQTLTLTGGKILSSNGIQEDNHSVTWNNPAGPIEAVLTEAPSSSWLPYLLILLGFTLLVVSIIGIVWRLRKPKLKSIPVQKPDRGQYCPNCGTPFLPEARFCPTCGARR
jgi:hypothetical protein